MNNDELFRVSRTLIEGLDLLRIRVDEARVAWVRADRNRLAAIVDGKPKGIIDIRTGDADRARTKYDEERAYYQERLDSNMDYIRRYVREEAALEVEEHADPDYLPRMKSAERRAWRRGKAFAADIIRGGRA